MKLGDLLNNVSVTCIYGKSDVIVSSLSLDSRSAEKGALFFALRGTTQDGHQYIDPAIRKGASAIVCETAPATLEKDVSYVVVPDSSEAMALMASAFYGNPSALLRLVGITGTNGKTTTVTLLHRLFRDLGYHSGLISTIRNRIDDTDIPATHTTPDVISLNRLLREMADAGCHYCFMEVSSHAVDQKRIAGLHFSGGIFSNITHDHLDYHKTFDAYLKAKKGFFDALPKESFALVNKDDRNGMVMLQNTKAEKYTYSLLSMADFRCRLIENRFQGLQLEMGGKEAWFRLTGRFNAYNLLAVYAAAILLGQDSTEVLTSLSNMEPVDGRFNTVVSSDHILAIIDYAHTPDALKNVLETIHGIMESGSRIITVAGAGGNRDTTKRPLMAKIASDMSDQVILTSDNPRFEEPEAIIEDMKKGIDPLAAKKVLAIVNRHEAIRTAYALAQPGDIILIAGKGHETYQEIKGVKYPFDDKAIVNEIFTAGKPGFDHKT